MSYQINHAISKKYRVAISGLELMRFFMDIMDIIFNKNINIINSKLIKKY